VLKKIALPAPTSITTFYSEAPASSSAPHFDGRHFSAVSLGGAGIQMGKDGDKSEMYYYNGFTAAQMSDPYGLKKLGTEKLKPLHPRPSHRSRQRPLGSPVREICTPGSAWGDENKMTMSYSVSRVRESATRAGCLNWASTDLCGGRFERAFPTAISDPK
jgi:hypothetical protein